MRSPRGEAPDIERGDMKAETAVVGQLVYRIPTAAMTPVDLGRAGQRDGKSGAGEKKVQDWDMRPTRTHSGQSSAAGAERAAS
jgi:hypothetical protein